LDNVLMEHSYVGHWWHLPVIFTDGPHSISQRRRQVPNLINRFLRHERGAAATEYAMLVVFIALAIAAGAQAYGGGLSTWFSKVSVSLTNPNPAKPEPNR
jgi:Flp pilus assembly pilin Flp